MMLETSDSAQFEFSYDEVPFLILIGFWSGSDVTVIASHLLGVEFSNCPVRWTGDPPATG